MRIAPFEVQKGGACRHCFLNLPDDSREYRCPGPRPWLQPEPTEAGINRETQTKTVLRPGAIRLPNGDVRQPARLLCPLCGFLCLLIYKPTQSALYLRQIQQ